MNKLFATTRYVTGLCRNRGYVYRDNNRLRSHAPTACYAQCSRRKPMSDPDWAERQAHLVILYAARRGGDEARTMLARSLRDAYQAGYLEGRLVAWEEVLRAAGLGTKQDDKEKAHE